MSERKSSGRVPPKPSAHKSSPRKPDPVNLWTTDRSYDPHNLYVGATDDKGHGTPMSIRMPPNFVGRVQALIESHKIPGYKTFSDFARDSMVHRLQFVYAEMVNDFELQAQVERWAAVISLEQAISERRSMDARVRGIIGEIEQLATDSQNPRRLKRDLESFRALAEQMDEDYSVRILRAIERQEDRLD